MLGFLVGLVGGPDLCHPEGGARPVEGQHDLDGLHAVVLGIELLEQVLKGAEHSHRHDAKVAPHLALDGVVDALERVRRVRARAAWRGFISNLR